MIAPQIDALTREWIRNASDEKAALNGCRFDAERGQFVVDWIQRYCRLYEGEKAGQPMMLEDWQYECTMRMFGWVRHSEDWNREIRRFRWASIWIPKKNGKSPTLAAWGLHLFCGDGEPGQKIYSVAKDGKQALISHTHALEMVRRSPELNSQCTINRSTSQITHESSRSFYRIVAGDNINSQEGLNGSTMTDETHVVDRRLKKVLRGAGISRSEPLHIEVSTAGNNPDGYGKSQFDYGTKVASGTLEDQEFFFQSYAAPQDVSDADLDANILEIGKAANPTWGRIVKQGEFLAEYKRSKVSITDLADFKMYRLNIWQSAANPWLRSGDWAACRREFTEETLEGCECYAGMDLSKTRDMTSIVLAFPEDDEVMKLLPYFFMPEEAAHKNAHLAPFLQWEKDGFLILTPGAVLDYGYVKAKFRKLAQQFRIEKLGYDKTYAEELTQALEQGQTDDDGNVIEKGTGVERLEIGQSIMNFADPTEEFERLVIAGKLHHNGHPILTWQAGHAQVRRDANGNKKPVKPSPDDIKKIDGIIAGIMGVHVAQRSGGGYYSSMYDEPGALSL